MLHGLKGQLVFCFHAEVKVKTCHINQNSKALKQHVLKVLNYVSVGYSKLVVNVILSRKLK